MTIDPLAPVTEFSELNRVGVIDVGSNSVRLVVFNGAARSPAYFYNEKIMCGLGRGIAQSGLLNAEGRTRALRALDRFKAVTDQMQVQSLTAVATAAVREASDGADFCAAVAARTGIEISVASGDEEARLSAQGVLLGWPTANGLVCDIGGASMELAELSNGSVGRCETSPLGPLKLANIEGGTAAVQSHIDAEIEKLRQKIDGTYDHLFLVGGSFRAIAKIDMALRKYPLDVLHEYKTESAALRDTLDWITSATGEPLGSLTSTSSERLKLVPAAAQVLTSLIKSFGPRIIAISSYGLREGLLFERMPEALRRRDPLIEACQWMERDAARFPGIGKPLADWVLQVLPTASEGRKRLVTAASLLHDVSWRAHPSFRADVCFDNATRSNLAALDHKGRIFLGMALLHRYKNSAKNGRYQKLAAVLTPDQMQAAVVTGRAIRLGASLASGAADVLRETKLTLTDKRLEITIPPAYEKCAGEAVTQRFNALAEALGRVPVPLCPPASMFR